MNTQTTGIRAYTGNGGNGNLTANSGGFDGGFGVALIDFVSFQ